MKIKNIRLNGTKYELEDQNALQLPEGVELEDGDVLVYNESEEGFECINRNSLVEVEKGIIENSKKVATSGDVYTAINAAVNPNSCNLEVYYDSTYQKIGFRVAQNTPAALKISVSLLVLSINTHYDSQQQELNFSNIVTILHLDKNTSSVEYQLDSYIDDRQFYFILINNSQNVQTCVLDRDSLLVPGVNEKTNVILTPSVDLTGADPGAKISVVSSIAVNTNININLEVINHDNTKTYVNGVLSAGSSQVVINIGSSGYSRICNISIVPVSVSSTQNYILQTNQLNVQNNIGLKKIIAEASPNSPAVIFRTEDDYLVNENIDILVHLPRNGVPGLDVTGTISANNSIGSISYENLAFNGPIAYVGLGNNNKEDYYEYYIENNQIQLIIDSDGNPY